MQLDALLRRFPTDATFNQSRFDVKIVNRVTNPSLYAGSVDLSQATDNLPASWGWAVWDAISDTRDRLGKPFSPIVLESAHLFRDVNQGWWLNGHYPVRWTIGQPLGSLPSFDLLGLTHNCLLEALSFSRALLHSPYCILGDDLLVFNKRLRRNYIEFMESAGVPLSIQKSYEGNLVEFAGKVFIKNQIPRYRSDQKAIGFHSLFDYQRSTGILIDYNKLPGKLRIKFSKTLASVGLPTSDCVTVYQMIQDFLITGDLSPDNPNCRDIDCAWDIYSTLDTEDEPLPDPILGSGVVNVGGHPVSFGDFGYAEKHGHLLRFRKVLLPEWYKDKVRPYTTENLIKACAHALSNLRERKTKPQGD
jgi:hypothetical protein